MYVIRTVSKIKEEVSWIRGEGRQETDRLEVRQRLAPLPIVEAAALAQHQHWPEHLIDPARRLVNGGHDRPPPLSDRLQSGHQPLRRRWVEPGRWLIKDEEARTHKHLVGDGHALPLPAGDAADKAVPDDRVGALEEAELRYGGLRSGGLLRPRQGPREAE